MSTEKFGDCFCQTLQSRVLGTAGQIIGNKVSILSFNLCVASTNRL